MIPGRPSFVIVGDLGLSMFMFYRPLTAFLLLSTTSLAAGIAVAQEAEETEDERVLGPVVVRGEFIPDEKRATSEISSLIDSDDFQVTGDPNAAAALGRVTGLAVSRGKFIFVRGLNERYTSATLNGSPLASPEPLRRVAPLDLFPTSVLDSVLVQKTWSPEFSGEFGGGLIELRTKAVPDESFLEIGGSVTARVDTTFQDGLLFDGGGTSDFLGFDDGTRNVPDALAPIFNNARVASLTSVENEAAAESLVNPALFIAQEGLVGPNGSFSAVGGTRFDVSPNVSIGLLGTLGYSSSFDTRIGVRQFVEAETVLEDGSTVNPDGSPVLIGDPDSITVVSPDESFERNSTENNIALNGLVSVGFELFDDHEIGLTAFVARSTKKEVRTFEGDDAELGLSLQENFEFFERQVFTLQARGEHTFPILGNIWSDLDDFSVAWRYAYSEAFREAPFQIVTEFDTNSAGDFVLSEGDLEGTTFQFSDIDDQTESVGVDLRFPLEFGFLPGRDVEIKAGYSYFDSSRVSFLREFEFEGGIPLELQDSRLDVVLAPENIGPDGFELGEVGGVASPEAFDGALELDAFYLAGEIQFTNFFRLSGGVRYEDSLQISDTSSPTFGLEGDDVIEAALSSEFYLPSITATWNFAENLQLRAGFSQTITRPQFRELAFSEFINAETDETFVGNPFLVNSQTDNFDARLEWYFGRGEFFTLGGFYKEIENPIEEIGAFGTDTEINSFINAPSAELYGFEIEFEKIVALDEWLGWGFLQGRDYVLRTNYTFTQSEVSSDGEIILPSFSGITVTGDVFDAGGFIIDGRQLQGQSDHIVNAQIGWDDEDAGARFRLLLNLVSDRIRSTEDLSSDEPAIFERVPISLDMTYSKQFNLYGGDYEFTFAARNLIGDDYEAFQRGTDTAVLVDSFSRGQTFSLGIKRIF